MPEKIVRLWERPDGRISALERPAEDPPGASRGAEDPELVRVVAEGGGLVFDVTVTKGPFRAEAERVLALARREVEPTSDAAGKVERARRAVRSVDLPPAPAEVEAPKPTRCLACGQRVHQGHLIDAEAGVVETARPLFAGETDVGVERARFVPKVDLEKGE